MNKAELITQIASAADIPKAKAEKALSAFVNGVARTLKKEESVTLVGFGTFSVSRRAARKGRNPQTGTEIRIPATKAPKFKPGKSLKDAVRVQIKFASEDDAKGSFLLSRTGPIQCLPEDTYLCGQEQLNILDEHGIHYSILTIVDPKPTSSNKVAIL